MYIFDIVQWEVSIMIESGFSKGGAMLKADKPTKEEVGTFAIFLSFLSSLALAFIGGRLVAGGK
ncbi:MAG: hypothetical protein ABDH18_00655 [Aquificaceae bacterium]